MTTAGGSARREYERRRALDRAARRAAFPRALLLVVVAPPVVYALVRLAAASADVDAASAHLLGVLLAALAGLRLAVDAWGARPTTESWRTGAEGEAMTARKLARLPEGYVVLHDRRMPRSRANIDHVVIGPTGVFTVETKHYSSEVVIRRGSVRRAGRSMTGVVDQAGRQAEAVRSLLGCDVRAVVCVQGAGVSVEGWFSKPFVDGVRFCSGRRLRAVLTKLPNVLAAEDVIRLSALAQERLAPA